MSFGPGALDFIGFFDMIGESEEEPRSVICRGIFPWPTEIWSCPTATEKTRLFLASVYRVGMPAPFLPSLSKLSTTIFLYLSIVILVVEADASLLLSAYSPSEQFLGRLFESFIG